MDDLGRAPVDDSTLRQFDALSRAAPLRQVIGWIEGKIACRATPIGIGHDVTRYYSRAVTIMDAEQLGGTMIGQLTDLFDAPAP